MSATEAVWRLAKWVAEWIEGELREPGTYGPCLVDLSYGPCGTTSIGQTPKRCRSFSGLWC